MRLEVASFSVRRAVFGHRMELSGGSLVVNREELTETILARTKSLTGVRVDLVHPGEAARIIHALDVVEPRCKVDGPGSVFPGFLGDPVTAGQGRTHRLADVAVVATTPVVWEDNGISVKEAVIDMVPPGSDYTPFSRTINVALSCELDRSAHFYQWDHDIRLAGLITSEYLGRCTADLRPDMIRVFDLPPSAPRASDASGTGLPRVIYVCTLMTEGSVHNTFVYGRKVAGLPAWLHPNEFFDGAIVSGNHHIAADRNPTYFQQNNPVINALYAAHGTTLDFAGVIIAETQQTSLADKERAASQTAKLAKWLGADGVVVTHDTAGHAAVNLMLTCQRCEQLGIRTVLVVNELNGPEGTDFGLVFAVPEADAIVSTGNKDEIIRLAPVSKVVGGDAIWDWRGYDDPVEGNVRDGFSTSLRRLYCSTTQLGAESLTSAAF
ncbi:MAG TPA: glycine/sarcosine/betaine reductase component B subunit [bacterium]|nr:glycine/sarcosine/betaine reductase component B subunit [bacterium]